MEEICSDFLQLTFFGKQDGNSPELEVIFRGRLILMCRSLDSSPGHKRVDELEVIFRRRLILMCCSLDSSPGHKKVDDGFNTCPKVTVMLTWITSQVCE